MVDNNSICPKELFILAKNAVESLE